MAEDERLREALLELETLRTREAETLRRTQALLVAVEALAASSDVEQGVTALLTSIRDSLSCDGVVLFEVSGDRLILQPRGGRTTTAVWDAPGLLTRARRIIDLQGMRGPWAAVPAELSNWRALISMPLDVGEDRMVFAAHSSIPGHFEARDAELLRRLGAIATQAVLRRTLERRNAFLASVIDGTPSSVAIAEVGEDLPLVYVNDSFVALSGYTREEMLGQNCRVLSAEDAGSPVRARIRATLAERGTGTFVVRNRRRDGSLFWNQLQLFPIADAGGAPSHIVATQTDITDRIQAEADRDEAQHRMEGALAATSDAFMIVGRMGHMRFANAPFRTYFAPHIGERGARLSPDLAGVLLDRDPDTLPDPVIGAFDAPVTHEIVAPDGRQLLLRSRPIPDGGVVVSASDVTQLKVSEQALRQRLAAIEISQDGIAIGDADGRIVDANPSLVSLLGLRDPADALGRKWTSFYARDATKTFQDAGSVLQRTGVFRAEAEIDLPSGRRIHEVSLSLVADLGSILVVRDVTDRRRDAAERDEMRRSLDRAQMQEQLHQVSAGLAHDFNNLLSAILGSASLLETANGLDDGARAATSRIQTAAERAAGLVDGLLDLGARDRSAETLDLQAVLHSTVDLARGSAPSNVRIPDPPSRPPLMIRASQTDLLQVTMNLVVNAIDALGGNPGEVRVDLRHPATPDPEARFAAGQRRAARSYAAIDVIDDGAGLSEDALRRVLEPYYTTKGRSGTGLGLSIVTGILGDAGGMLEIDSTEGEGTRMTVWWPLDTASDDASDPGPGARRASHLPILVLDDSGEVAAHHAGILSGAGFETAEVDDPEIALEVVAEDPDGWGCLITDYDMPGLTGGDVIERLTGVAPTLPVIVVSALARRLTDDRLSRASLVLQKPVDGDTLVAAVRNVTGADTEGHADEDTSG